MTIEEEDEDPRNINIPEAEGHPKVEGPQIENLDITALLKTRQVNIGIEAELKFAKIRTTGMMLQWIRSLSCSMNIRICSPQSF